jgi:hypothetical protein
MSNYRDDSNDTAVISDGTWTGLSALVGDFAKAGEALLFGLLVLHTSGAVASDQAFDAGQAVIQESAIASDQIIDSVLALSFVADQAKAGDVVTQGRFVLHEDSASASDQLLLGAPFALTVDSVRVSEDVIAMRTSRDTISDQARAADSALQAATELIADSALAGDVTTGKLCAADTASDTVLIGDELVSGRDTSGALVESARIDALVLDHLDARQLVEDVAQIDAGPVGDTAGGSAWTAHADGWALSRYAPFAFTSISVINDVAYVSTADGLYALNGENEQMLGSIRTGKLDLSGGGLVHPVHALIEYELDGTASMAVSQTQSGNVERYSYALPSKLAGEQTNGRFTFGRGLRGRHFTFELTLKGKRAYINDLGVLVSPTNRRI